ncbi:MAG: phosphotransferase [bacterium]|nr:phosphotransferase [bacterium]
MDARPAVRSWLETTSPGAKVERLAGDASSRSFYRIRDPSGATRIVMDYGEPFDDTPADVELTRIFELAELPVARIFEVHPQDGFLVLEDLGVSDLETAFCAAGADERSGLLERAIDLAAGIADAGTASLAASVRADGPALDADRFRFEMRFFVEHYACGLRKLDSVTPSLERELNRLADAAAATPRVLCHRDYHSRNLILRASGDLALVDIQDARWGPDTYDLASILRDAYIEIDESWIEPLVERYRRARGRLTDPDDLPNRLAVVSAQRMIKALGTFGFQAERLGRTRYLEGVPRTLERLRRLLPTHPATAELAKRLDAANLLEDPA